MRTIITGGAGFIGCNAAARYIRRGDQVLVLDNLSRPGADLNLRWLQSIGPFEFIEGDIRDYGLLKDIFSREEKIDSVLHLAAQVAVTTSVTDPRNDFEVNALGTFNVLEAIRESGTSPAIVFSSTNKVYGNLDDMPIRQEKTRYSFGGNKPAVREVQPLDFHSPYGCSKGSADQYVRDYSRIYGFKTVVMRQSCIYGPRQFGIEDQGWVAWFIIAALTGKKITVYGDGKQVRDILYMDDLLDSFDAAIRNIDRCAGKVFNVGGGPENTISLLEFLDLLEEYFDRKIDYTFSDWRPGDQKIYVSDITKAAQGLNWKPQVTNREGIKRLYDWVSENKQTIERAFLE